MEIKNIKEQALEILTINNLLKVPVNVELLAKKLSIDIELKDLDNGVSGFLVRRNNNNIIGLNENHHPVRRRFTISHEIGHFILHINKPLFVDYYKGSMLFRSNHSQDYEVEKQANLFAACLLMPENLISSEMSRFSDFMDYESKLLELSTTFQVSEQAMDYRLKTLGYYDYGF